jgi:hypothetical protein
MRKSKTHFEQIPVEVVKRLAEEEFSPPPPPPPPQKKANGNHRVIAKISAQRTEPDTGGSAWRTDRRVNRAGYRR